MKAEAGSEIHLLLGYALQTPAPVNGENVVELDPIFSYPLLNLLVPIIVIVLVTIVLHFLLGGRLSWREYQTGLWILIVGKDGRLSTSKVQFMLWTFAIVLALLLLLCFGKDFRWLELQPEYLLLLGSPAATALLAKTITSTKVSNGTVEDTKAEEPSVKDVVTNDDGNTDLFDFQYFLFNLVLLAWFAVEMFRTLSDSARMADNAYLLPPLPLSLVGLTSVSAAGYVVKKGLESERPVLLAAYPSKAAPYDRVLLTGRNLKVTSAGIPVVGPPGAGDAEGAQGDAGGQGGVGAAAGSERVTFDGRLANVSSPLSTNAQGIDEIEVFVPADVPIGSAPVRFTRSDEAFNEPTLGFDVVPGGPKVSSVNPDRVVLGDDLQQVTIFGLGFGDPDPDNDPPQNRVSLGGVPLDVLPDNWTAERIAALVPALANAKEHGLTAPGQHDLVVVDRYGRRSTPEKIVLAEVATPVLPENPGVPEEGDAGRRFLPWRRG